MRALLDTSVVLAADIGPLEGELAINAATLLLQRSFDALPLEEAVAHSYGRLSAAVVDAGRKPRGRVMDLVIAATAHAHDACLYTRNPDDFRGLEDQLDVVSV